MKIACVSPRYYPDIGGVETQVKETCERLVKNFDIEILTTNPSKELPREEIINDVQIKRFKSWTPNESYCFSRELRTYLNRNSNNYDVVHAHQYHAMPALYAARAKKENQLVFTPHYHGKGHTFFRNMLHKPYRLIGKSIFRKADKIVCVSKYEKDLILDQLKINEEKITIIPNGVDLEAPKSLKRTEKNHRTILCVCRLEEYKGVQYLLEVLPKLDQNMILEIVGKGAYKHDLVKLANKLHLNDRITFYQDLTKEELMQKYVDADLFVLLSRYEAFGVSVAEALASGTPCIVANTSALSEWVDNDSCFGVEYPINSDTLGGLIERVIGRRVHASKLFSWNEIAAKIADLYNDLSA